MNTWLQMAQAVPVLDVAVALGLTIGRDGKSFGPCPGCDVAMRNNPGRPQDRRGRCRVDKTPSGEFWACCSNGSDGCGARGGGPALVAWQLTGKAWQKGDSDTCRKVRAWFVGGGWCDPAPGERIGVPQVRRTAPAAQPEPPLSRPDAYECAQVWFHAAPVTADPETATYLSGRGLDPSQIAALDVARAWPADLAPPWARRGWRTWQQSGHRLIVGLWEPDPTTQGHVRMVSLHVRCVRPCDDNVKALSPQGHSHKGLVMASRADFLAEGASRRLLTVCEGLSDFLALALQSPEMRGALIGGISGSASAAILALVPTDWTVAVATDADPGGELQARAWKREIERRGCRYVRCVPPEAA